MAPQDERPGSASIRIACDPEKPEPRPSKKSGMKLGFTNASSMVRQKLRALDSNNDGSLDEEELIRGIEQMLEETRLRKMFMFIAAGLLLVVLVLVGAIGGMTYGIIEATKDTTVKGSVLVTAHGGSNPNVVQTANYDMTVVNGVLVSRTSNGTANGTANSTASAVLRSAPFTTQMAFSSLVDVKALMEMKYFYVKSETAEVALAVQGVGRIPKAGSVHGTVVKILTLAGTIVLDDTMISFTEDVAPIFSEAGFSVDVSGRRLLGVYDVFGFFAYIEDMTVFNLPKNEPKPSLPSGDFQMKLKLWEPCVLDYDGTPSNRCQYTAGHPGYAYNTTSNVTTSGRRMLASNAGNTTLVVPGAVTLEDGADYMTSVETVTRVGTLVRTVYEYEGFPDLVKIEVMDETYKNVTQWQAYKQREFYAPKPGAFWCSNFKLPGNFFSSASSTKNVSGTKFEWIGYSTIMGTAARHFKLTIPQLNKDGSAGDSMSVDYYDRADNKYPLFFDFYHPTGGHMMIHIQEFTMLNSTTRPTRASMLPPATSTCTNPNNVPRMGSAFTLPPQDVVVSTGPKGNFTTVGRHRRHLLSYDERSGKPRANGPKPVPAYLLDPDYDPERPWMSAAWNESSHNPRRRTGETCTSETTIIALPLGVCDLGWYSVSPPSGTKIELECGGAFPAFPLVAFKGSASINTCSGDIEGCVSVVLSLTAGLPSSIANSKPIKVLTESFGIEDISLLSICGGYSYTDKEGYVKGTYSGPPLYLWIAKAELAAEMRFSSCCTWVESVGLEVFVGIDFGFWSSYTSVGTITFIENYYLSGSATEEEEASNPTITNSQSEITPTEGYWGDWSANSYCYTTSLSGTSTGIAVKGVSVRMESDSADDDTALNGIRLKCSDDSVLAPNDGYWGDWTSYAECPDNTYVTGARMRLESTGGDDTAANSIQLKCSKGDILNPHEGYWGSWMDWVTCPDKTFVCGIKVRMESEQGSSDDTALNGATLFCCSTSTS